MGFTSIEREVEAELAEAENPYRSTVERLLDAFRWEQEWRSRGEIAIREEMERRLRKYGERVVDNPRAPRQWNQNSRRSVPIDGTMTYAELQRRRNS